MFEKNYEEEQWQDMSGESPENPEDKCLWTLVIDTSGSMGPRMKKLDKSLQQLKEEVENDPIASQRMELSIIEFHSKVKVRTAPKLITDVQVPKLKADGMTSMVDAIDRAVQVVDTRLKWYEDTQQAFYRPYVVLITDGAHNGPGKIEDAARLIKHRTLEVGDKEKIFFLAFGVQDADMDELRKLTGDGTPPIFLDEARFSDCFKWIANSVKKVADSSREDKDALQKIADSVQDEFQESC